MGLQSGYGIFPGGDPRDFHPDPECSTDAEREAHAKDCAAWDAWEASGCAGPMPEPSVKNGHQHFDTDGMVGWVTFAGYGLGSYTYEDDGDDDSPNNLACDGSPSCPCAYCDREREWYDEQALIRHRSATRSTDGGSPHTTGETNG